MLLMLALCLLSGTAFSEEANLLKNGSFDQISSDGFTLEEKTDTAIVQGSMIFDLDLSAHGGNVILNWENLC